MSYKYKEDINTVCAFVNHIGVKYSAFVQIHAPESRIGAELLVSWVLREFFLVVVGVITYNN